MLENIQIKTVSAWREKETASPAALTKNRVVNHFVHPPFNTALCAVTVSLSPTPRTRPRSRQPRTPRHITPANHHNHNLQQIYCSSSIVGYPRPGATCQLSERKEESLSLLRCSVRACQNVTEWLAGYLVRCTVHYCTLHCTLDTVWHCLACAVVPTQVSQICTPGEILPGQTCTETRTFNEDSKPTST